MSRDAEHIIHLIDKFFDVPCQYEFDDTDAYDFCNSADEETGIFWCEENCGRVSSFDCWKHFFMLMMKCENEQLEYGGGLDAD